MSLIKRVSFVYDTIILDVWWRMIVGYAISHGIDARLTGAALRAAIERRKPPPGCVHHCDRGSQCAAETYRQLLSGHGLGESRRRKGNPYNNAEAESCMNTLKA
ncbi:DDE-type integrase/transposase/recombinase [Mesorhizobium sp.]|uniref:DDE-type integrase/transposase/recombinase n=1 Tax=Mesorhizobium sp. TaxID=1871066 RepID=UPI0025ED8037|nr:DDE-type integrase/transposase/recombinase [Mesorhizobium sp.]